MRSYRNVNARSSTISPPLSALSWAQMPTQVAPSESPVGEPRAVCLSLHGLMGQVFDEFFPKLLELVHVFRLAGETRFLGVNIVP